jgi:hypothetical protein
VGFTPAAGASPSGRRAGRGFGFSGSGMDLRRVAAVIGRARVEVKQKAIAARSESHVITGPSPPSRARSRICEARMPQSQKTRAQAKREYTQLLRLHEQLLNQLSRARDALMAPGTMELVKEIKGRTGEAPDLTDIKTSVEEAIRALKLSQSHIRVAVSDDIDTTTFEVEGIVNMPAYLQRFLAERSQEPGFTYGVENDAVRGWIVSWKEYTNRGTVRGYGQFCERPYAWLDD